MAPLSERGTQVPIQGTRAPGPLPVLHGPKGNHLDPCLPHDACVEQERIKHDPLPDSIPERMTAGLALSLAQRPRPCCVCGRLQRSRARNHCTVCGKFVNGHAERCSVLIGHAARTWRRSATSAVEPSTRFSSAVASALSHCPACLRTVPLSGLLARSRSSTVVVLTGRSRASGCLGRRARQEGERKLMQCPFSFFVVPIFA